MSWLELEKNKEKVISTIQTEESQFDKTLDHGIEHFTKAVQNSTTKTISGTSNSYHNNFE